MKKIGLALRLLQLPMDALMLMLAGILAYQLRLAPFVVQWKPVLFDISFGQFVELTLWATALTLVVYAFAGLYRLDETRKLFPDIRRIFSASFVSLALVSLFIVFTQDVFASRFLLGVSFGFGVLLVIIGRALLRGVRSLLARRGIGLRRVLLIGSGEIAEHLARAFAVGSPYGYRVVDRREAYDTQAQQRIAEGQVDDVILASAASPEQMLEMVEYTLDHHVGFRHVASTLDAYSTNTVMQPIDGVPLLALRRTPLEGWGRVWKRLFDIAFSFLILLITLPITIVSAIVILIETGRPVLYKNKRVGMRGTMFFAYKLRSMYQRDSTGEQFGKDGEKALEKEQQLRQHQNSKEGPIYKIHNDPRVTPFGRFIRRWSIDELPQCWNVIRGEMSVVGPRPHQPREVQGYHRRHTRVFALRPGITGLAQISGRSDLSYEQEMRLDLYYTESWSMLLDILIVIKTPFMLFRKRQVE